MDKGKTIATVALAALALAAGGARAASHREAPFITEMPKVDGTDFYLFRSYEPGREAFVTLVANYLPLQDAYGGPNFFALDPDALYEIHVDNNGDGREDVTFRFRFRSTLRDLALNVGGKEVSIPLVNAGRFGPAVETGGALNVVETYTLEVVRGSRRTGPRQPVTNAATGARTFNKPADNIGNNTFGAFDTKSPSQYAQYARNHVFDIAIPGCASGGKVFVGQRKESFVVNLGEIFDLLNISKPAVELSAGAESAEPNTLGDKNITSLALEVPISCLTAGGDGSGVIGGWTTASLPQARVLNRAPAFAAGTIDRARAGGAFTQVSRLGMPLVNELVIGLKDKDRFNASEPKDDGQFLTYVTNPTLPALIEALFGPAGINAAAGVRAPSTFPRNDLVATFLTGIKGLNQPADARPAEMVRLNTGIAATAAGAQQRLGVIGGDDAGFPNGRRPGDDVVDIELRVAMGKLIQLGLFPGTAPSGGLQFTDGAIVTAGDFDEAFPYLASPSPGSGNGPFPPNNGVQ